MIVTNLDVMLARRKMSLQELSERSIPFVVHLIAKWVIFSNFVQMSPSHKSKDTI